MAKNFTVTEFFKRFPDDTSCLQHLFEVRFGASLDCPKCGKHGKFSKITKVPAYQCSWCAYRIHPMAGTPFERSSTPLQKWFYAMYLFTTSRHGVPAKELQRQLGVTYKTAWRMGHEIRKYMGKVDGDGGLAGHVEVDEAYIGGKDDTTGNPNNPKSNKTPILGMVERNGNLMTYVLPNVRTETLIPLLRNNIEKGSTISSDSYNAYRHIAKHGYKHGWVKHSLHQYKKGIYCTNTIEGFWSRLKNSINGTHVHVSRKYLQNYLVEFEYRFNMRANPSLMFDRLLLSF